MSMAGCLVARSRGSDDDSEYKFLCVCVCVCVYVQHNCERYMNTVQYNSAWP